MTDLEKIALIATGDRTLFKQLYDEFHKRAYNTAISILQHPAEAEEIVQDVFIEVHRSAKNFKGDSSISTWIYRITVNKSLDQLRYRKRKKRSAFLISLFTDAQTVKIHPPDFNHPGVLMENKERAAILFKAIDRLSDHQKSAFVLSQVEELPQKEIAEIMNLSQKAVESLIQRAKVNLRKELEEFYPNRRKS